MKLKKKTRKRLTAIMALFLCFMMLLPLIADFFAKPSGQDMLAGEIIKAQLQTSEEESNTGETEIEGSYLITDVITADTFKILWGDEERTIKLIGVRGDEAAVETIRELVEARIFNLAFDQKEEDADGNLLVYAYSEQGEFLNEKLILEGLATFKKDPDNRRLEEILESAQVMAKNNGVGIWSHSQGGN